MSNSVHRVRAHFSTIQITMISIVVALALQELLDRLPTLDALWEPSWLAVRLWCQVLTAAAIVVKMWVGFVLTASIIERVPRPLDLLGPMAVLVFVDAQIASIDAEHVLRWLYVLGVGQLVASVFIAGQRLTVTGTLPALAQPAAIEAAIGVVALAAAFAEQAIGLGASGLLVACAVMFVVEAATAVGPISAWRALARTDDRLRLDEPDDAQPS